MFLRPLPWRGLSAQAKFAVLTATAGGIGLAPVLPGTFGSLPGLALGWWLFPCLAKGFGAISVVFALTMMTLLAWWSIHVTETNLKIHDDQRIVVDEVAGQALATAFLPQEWTWFLAAFVLFRFFDMTKPSVIGRIDREVPGAMGTLGDDVLAGVLVAVILAIVRFLI